MTDDNRQPDDLQSNEQGERRTDTADDHESQDTATDWDEVSADPSAEDLGYETSQWERVPGPDDIRIMLIPTRESVLHDQEFIILDESSFCDLMRCR